MSQLNTTTLTPTFAKQPTIADIERFLKYVEVVGCCWIWKGSKTPLGYARFNYVGSGGYAHRFSYLISNKLIKGMDIDHLCRNRSCVNPKHLEQVTHKINLLRSEKQVSTINSKKEKCTCGNLYELNTNGGRFCKICANQNRRQSRLKNPELWKIRNKERARRNRAKKLRYLVILCFTYKISKVRYTHLIS